MPRTNARRLGRIVRLAAALGGGVSAGLAGCAGTLVLPETRPADYAMLVTVYPGAEADGGRAFRPARYAVESDGLLRAEAGAGVVDTGLFLGMASAAYIASDRGVYRMERP